MDKSLKILFSVIGVLVIFAAGYIAAEYETIFDIENDDVEIDIDKDSDQTDDEDEDEDDDDSETDEDDNDAAGYFESGDVDYTDREQVRLEVVFGDAASSVVDSIYYYDALGNYVNDGDWDRINEHISMYKIGTINNGKYDGDDLYLMHAECMGMCISPYAYKFVQSDGRFIHLSRYDSSTYVPEHLQGFFEYSDNAVIDGLKAPESINVPGKDLTLRLSEEYIINSDGTEFENRLGSKVLSVEGFGDFYERKKFDYTPREGCLYMKAPDGLYYRYEIDPDFLDPINDVTINKSTGESINVSADYTYSSTGCGVTGNCYRVDNFALRELTYIGDSSNGYEFYTPNGLYEGAASERGADLIHQLADTMFSSYNNYVEEISFEDFVDLDPILLWKDELGRYGSLMRTDLQPPAECGKPVIYLYPEQTTDVSVKVDIDQFTVTVPDYKDGWLVSAEPNGQLYNYDDKQTYDYLFWEGISDKGLELGDYGFVVKRNQLRKFLGISLNRLGLNRTEIKDFKEFWVPEMLKNNEKYFEITFIGTEDFNRVAPLSIEPKPDSVLRVFMNYEPVNYKRELEPQKLVPFERNGFTVVEWGGTSSRFHGIK